MSQPLSDDQRPGQFQRFQKTLKSLLSVPKKEIDEKVEQDRKRREAERKQT